MILIYKNWKEKDLIMYQLLAQQESLEAREGVVNHFWE